MGIRIIIVLGVVLLSYGCAHSSVQETDPQALLEQACRPGLDIKSVKGSAWVKATSKDASGQFPADILVTAPDQLKMEVTNLIGATQALITLNGSHYKIQIPGKNPKQYQGEGYWGGIPLRWATDLFLGKIPCPSSQDRKTAKVSVDASGKLTAETVSGDRYIYSFRSWEGLPWAETLHWEKAGKANSVDFKFDAPEEHSRSPKIWEAVSTHGEVKLRWKDRTY